MVWFWHQNETIDQWIREHGPKKKDPHIYGQLTLDKVQSQFSGERIISLTNFVEITEYPYEEKINQRLIQNVS
jgi:hypothetical protein